MKRTAKSKPAPAPAPLSADKLAESRAVLDAFARDYQLTVDGKPVPPGDHKIPFAMTDQGIALANVERNRTGSGVQIKDRFEMQLEARADQNIQTWQAPDPLKEAIDQVREPGFRYRAISTNVVKKRGRRGWEPCVKNGEPVKMADMVIARMPEEQATMRNEHYRREANEALADAKEHYQQSQERALRDGGMSGSGALRDHEVLSDYRDGRRVASTGLERQRGNAHFPAE